MTRSQRALLPVDLSKFRVCDYFSKRRLGLSPAPRLVALVVYYEPHLSSKALQIKALSGVRDGSSCRCILGKMLCTWCFRPAERCNTPSLSDVSVTVLLGAVGVAPLLFRPLCVVRAPKISEEHREKFRFDKFVVVAPCDGAGGAAGSGPAMLSDFYFSKFDDELLLQVRASTLGMLRIVSVFLCGLGTLHGKLAGRAYPSI